MERFLEKRLVDRGVVMCNEQTQEGVRFKTNGKARNWLNDRIRSPYTALCAGLFELS